MENLSSTNKSIKLLFGHGIKKGNFAQQSIISRNTKSTLKYMVKREDIHQLQGNYTVKTGKETIHHLYSENCMYVGINTQAAIELIFIRCLRSSHLLLSPVPNPLEFSLALELSLQM